MKGAVLVTGGNGQLGSSMKKVLVREGLKGEAAEVLVAGRRRSFEIFGDFLFSGSSSVDITEKDDLHEAIAFLSPQAIVNCAAYTAVDMAEDEPEKAFKTNALALEYLAGSSLEMDIPIVHISTDYVFDGSSRVPYRESDTASPLNVYGKSKRAGEEILADSGCRCIIIRTSWLYSEFGKNFFNTIFSLTASGRSLKVVDDQSGRPTYAADLARFIIKAASGHGHWMKNESRCGIYNYSNSGEAVSWYGFAKEINRLSGHNSTIEPCSSADYGSKAVRPAYSVLDLSLVEKEFGMKIRDWKEALAECVEASVKGRAFGFENM